MNIGKLDRRITVQAKTSTRDANGGVVETWAALKDVWAGKLDTGGREARAAGTILPETDTIFTVRYYSGLTTHGHRISYGGAIYNILSIAEQGRREGMLLQCKTEVFSS